jgi:hypothetical protein
MSVFIGICNSQEAVPSGFFWSFVNIRMPGPVIIYRSGHPWDVIRNNIMISEFLKSDCTMFAKMDIDQMYPPDYFERLIPLVDQYKVVGPMIYDRWKENGYMPLAFNKINTHCFPTGAMNDEELKGIVEVPYPHTNLVYHREVLEKVSPPWYQAYLTPDGLNRLNHVDFLFIEKIHQAGYKIMIDCDCEVKHMTIKFVGKEYANNRNNKKLL